MHLVTPLARTTRLATWETVLACVEEATRVDPACRVVLDVAPGWGKAERLLREYLSVGADLDIDCVEKRVARIRQYDLTVRYDEIHECDVSDLDSATLARYDLVLLVDVLEHMTLDAGYTLLGRIPGWMVICVSAQPGPDGDGRRSTRPPVAVGWSRDFWLAHERLDAYTTNHDAAVVRLRRRAQA
jgi:hypothetical protein